MQWFIGSDPEYFLFAEKGAPVPAHKVWGGKDDKETPFPSSWPGIKLFHDGYALEINIPAHFCREVIHGHIYRALEYARIKAHKAGYHLVNIPTIKVDPATLVDAPEDVKHFGCDPSFDAYTGDVKVCEVDAMTHPYRYAGGHMHLSAPYEDVMTLGGPASWLADPEKMQLFIRMCDRYIGLPLSFLFESKEVFQRRQVYGQAGEYRPQVYGEIVTNVIFNGENIKGRSRYLGVEYRSPGPELWHHPAIASLAFGVMRKIADHFDYLREKVWDKDEEAAIRNAMNTGEGLVKMLSFVPGFYRLDDLQWLRQTEAVTGPFVQHSPAEHAGYYTLASTLRHVLPDNYGWGLVPVPAIAGERR